MISTKGRYALRIMIDLAEHQEEKCVPLHTTASRQGISKKYLEIIVKDLVKARLVVGVSGKGGGYRLCRPVEDYSVGEILEVTEGSMASVACLAAGAEKCPREAACQTVPMWREYDQMVHDFFYGKKLTDLMQPAE